MSEERSILDTTLDLFSEVFLQFCQVHNLAAITVAADKYGSFVWEAGRRDDLNRYITLALTPLSDTSRGGFHSEVIIGADNDSFYVRRTAFEWYAAAKPFDIRE